MERRTLQAKVHRGAKSWTRLKQRSTQKARWVKEGPLYIYSESKLELSGEDGGL